MSAQALHTLDRLRRLAEHSERLTPSPGMARDGQGTQEEVEIPAAGGELPTELRDSIQEAGRSTWPRPYEDSLRRFYERLLR